MIIKIKYSLNRINKIHYIRINLKKKNLFLNLGFYNSKLNIISYKYKSSIKLNKLGINYSKKNLLKNIFYLKQILNKN